METEKQVKPRSKLLTLLIIFVILGAAVALAVYFVKTKPKARRTPPPEMVTLVEIITASPTTTPVIVEALGTLIPAEEVILQSEVGGRITWKHPDLLPGGIFEAGTELVKIDERDYLYAVEERRAAVEKAAVDLEMERSRKAVAEEEWRLLENDVPSSESGRALALREPQLKAAEAALKAAESTLQKADLNLERATIEAPFNATILEEFVDPGQLVGTQTTIARLAGTDEFWVKVSIPVGEVTWIVLPDEHGQGGSPAVIYQDVGNGTAIEREGLVVRFYADLEPAGRMARLLISIKDPLHLETPGEDNVPLLLNSYVRAQIQGRPLVDVFELPRKALHEGDVIWIADDEGRLEVRAIDIVWEHRDLIYVKDGLEPGDRIVTSRIAIPIPGMKLRLPGEAPEKTAPEADQQQDG